MSRLRKLVRKPRQFLRDALHRRFYGEVPSRKIFWTCPLMDSDSDSLRDVRELISWGRMKEAVSRLEERQASLSAQFAPNLLLATVLAYLGNRDHALMIAESLWESKPDHLSTALLLAGLAWRAGRPDQALDVLSGLKGENIRNDTINLLKAVISGKSWHPSVSVENLSIRRLNRIAATLREITTPSELGKLDRDILRGDWRHACLAIEIAISLFYPPLLIESMVVRLIRGGKLTLRAFCRWVTDRNFFLPFFVLRGLRPREITHFNLLLGIARQLEADHREQEALSFVEQALKAGESSAGTLMLAANLNRSLQHYDQAASFYKRLLNLRPDDDIVLESLARSEREGCLSAPARPWKLFDTTVGRLLKNKKTELATGPDNFSKRLAYARMLVKFELWVEANAFLKNLLVEYPEDGDVLWCYLMVCCALGRSEEASSLGVSYLLSRFDDRILTMVCSLLRNSGQVDRAEKIFDSLSGNDHWQTRTQYIKTLFFSARFEEVRHQLQHFLASYPLDLRMRLLAVATALELGDVESADGHLQVADAHPDRKTFQTEIYLFQYAVRQKGGNLAEALARLNELFASFNLRRVRQGRKSGAKFFDNLETKERWKRLWGKKPTSQPLVTVIMTTFNSAEYVATSIKSILRQGHRNLELLIVDDNSSDETLFVLDQFAVRDSRIRVIRNVANSGTYVCKNIALRQAKGEYIAFQDSDDWSHPDRIAKSVAVLASGSQLEGINTAWVRMTSDGELVIRSMGDIASMSCISLVMKRTAFERLGFFDSVRIGADTELIARAKAHFGRRSIPYLQWPMLLGRSRSGSLTTSIELGIFRTSISEPRRLYDNAYKEYHKQIAEGGSPYMPFPLDDRKFPAPKIIQPKNA